MKKDYCLVFWRGDYGEGKPQTVELARECAIDTQLSDTEAFEELVEEAKKKLI